MAKLALISKEKRRPELQSAYRPLRYFDSAGKVFKKLNSLTEVIILNVLEASRLVDYADVLKAPADRRIVEQAQSRLGRHIEITGKRMGD